LKKRKKRTAAEEQEALSNEERKRERSIRPIRPPKDAGDRVIEKDSRKRGGRQRHGHCSGLLESPTDDAPRAIWGPPKLGNDLDEYPL